MISKTLFFIAILQLGGGFAFLLSPFIEKVISWHLAGGLMLCLSQISFWVGIYFNKDKEQ